MSHLKEKFTDVIGFIGFVLIVILISPFLFITGGIVRIIRYIRFVSDKVNDRKPKKYDW